MHGKGDSLPEGNFFSIQASPDVGCVAPSTAAVLGYIIVANVCGCVELEMGLF